MCLAQQSVLRHVGITASFLFAMALCYPYSVRLVAGEVIDSTIGENQGVYQLHIDMILDAPFKDVRHVITDYRHIYRINPSIVESEVLPTQDKSTTRILTLINDCVLFFCQDLLRVENVRELGDNNIYSVIVPQLSNVRSGNAHWQIRSMGDKTRVIYDMTLEPGFFVPPLIGSYIVRNKIRKLALISLNNIERLALIQNKLEKARNSAPIEALPMSTTSNHAN
jgi:hypothetical protein